MRTQTDARAVALDGLLDDAGMFPPASLPLAAAVERHRADRAAPHAFVLSGFVVASARLDEIAAISTPPPVLTMLLSGDEQRVRVPGGARIARVERKAAGDVAGLVRAARTLVPEAEVFVEVAAGDADVVGVLRDARAGAKVRCGGDTAGAFPSADALAETIAACAEHGVRLKATAGLHAPVRALDEADGFVHHGFLNMLGACAVAASSPSPDAGEIAAVLADEDASAFALDAPGLRWRERTFGPDDLTETRALFAGIGSCSIAEPVEALRAMGSLP